MKLTNYGKFEPNVPLVNLIWTNMNYKSTHGQIYFYMCIDMSSMKKKEHKLILNINFLVE